MLSKLEQYNNQTMEVRDKYINKIMEVRDIYINKIHTLHT